MPVGRTQSPRQSMDIDPSHLPNVPTLDGAARVGASAGVVPLHSSGSRVGEGRSPAARRRQPTPARRGIVGRNINNQTRSRSFIGRFFENLKVIPFLTKAAYAVLGAGLITIAVGSTFVGAALAIGAGVYLSYKLYESYKNAQAIRTEVAQARQDIAAANEVVDSLEEEVRQACARTESIQRNADEMQDALAEAERRDSAMREQINAQQEQMEAQRESFARFTSFTTDLAERLRICAEEAQASARSIAEEAEISMKQTLESLGELNADVGLQIDGAQGLIEEGFAEINRLVDLQKELLAAGTEAYRNAAPGEEREGAARLCESVGRAVEINFQISQKANDLHRATRGALDNVKITVVNHVQKLTQEALEHGANLAVKVSELGRAQMSEQNLQMELSALDAEFHRESRAWSRDRARISELDEAISERTTLLAQCHERIRDIRGEVNMLSGNLAKIEGNNSKLSQITANLESHMGEIDRRTSVASNGIEWPVVLGGILGAGIMGGTAALTGIGAGAAVAWVAQRCGVLEMIVPDFNDFTLQFTADDRHSFGET